MTVSCLPAIVSRLSDDSEHVKAGQPAPPPGSSPSLLARVVAPATTGLDPHHLAGNQTLEGLSASDAQAAEDNPATLLKTLESQCVLKTSTAIICNMAVLR